MDLQQIIPSYQQQPRISGAARFFWSFSILAAILGGLFGFLGFVFAKGAPQEAAAAAMGCMVAIVPYCVARAVDELTRRGS